MKPLYFSVDVLMKRVPLVNRWTDEKWQPEAVVAVGEGMTAPGAAECVGDDDSGTTWRFPAMPVELHPTESEGYFLNLTSPAPVVFVMWRTGEDGEVPAVRPVIVTLSYNEAGRFMDGGERVDPVRDARADPRVARRVRDGALQARAQAQGEAQRPVRGGREESGARAGCARALVRRA